MVLKDYVLSLGLYLSKRTFVPFLAQVELRRLLPFKAFTLNGICRALLVSEAQASTIYKRSVKNYTSLGTEFFFISKLSRHAIRKRLDKVKVVEEERLSEVFASPRPVLIVTIYMGNFPLGFLKLMATVKNDRKVFVFKVNEQSANEQALFAMFKTTTQDIEPLRVVENGGKRAFLELRKKNVVAMMVDAEVHVQSRKAVSCLNYNFLMQSGPAVLAVLTKAVILPIINYEDSNGRLVVQVEPTIDPNKYASLPNDDVVSFLTQGIADIIEKWVRIAPSQVQRWPSIVETLSRGVPKDENHS